MLPREKMKKKGKEKNEAAKEEYKKGKNLSV